MRRVSDETAHYCLGLAGHTLLVAFGVGVWRPAPGNRGLHVVGGTLVMFGVLALWAVPFAW